MTKQAKGWAVIGPDGAFFCETFRNDQSAAIKAFDVNQKWDALVEQGYRCVPVTIEWRE